MKAVLILTGLMALLTVATVGCLIVFEVLSQEQGVAFIGKALAALLIIGATSAVFALVTRKSTATDKES